MSEVGLSVANAMHEWAVMVTERIENRWDNLQGVKGEHHVSANIPVELSGFVTQRIEAWGQAAWIIEYGSGSLSDTESNPYIGDYISDEMFNHYRSKVDMTIRGRDEGTYTDLDGNEYYSSGKMAGKDLELKPVYRGMTMIPMHVVEEECTMALPELQEMVENAVCSEIAKTLTVTRVINL